MSLGKMLKELVGSRKQEAVACEWLEHWRAAGGKEFSTDHAVSSLSRCLNEKIEGARFFFEERKRAVILLDVLKVPEEARQSIHDAAEKLLANGGRRPPKLVIDLTAWTGEREAVEALAVTVEETIVSKTSLRPVAIIITDAQYRWLPRTFDDFGDALQVERVLGREHARSLAQELATDSALVLSPWRFAVFDRWAAIGYKVGAMQVEPADALDRFAREGKLSGLPNVEHDAALLDGLTLATKVPEPPSEGPKLRRLIEALSSPDLARDLRAEVGVRVAWAQRLEIKAAATEREAIESEFRRLQKRIGLNVDAMEGAEGRRDQLLERAMCRVVSPAAFRVGDELHVVAPEGAVPGEIRSHRLLRFHPIEHRVPALTRLRDALSDWTLDDLRDDPYLEHLLRTIGAEDRERIQFAHARASLLRARAIRPAAHEPLQNWRAGLEALLQDDPPAVDLMASVAATAAIPGVLLKCAESGDLSDLAIMPPAGELLISREETLCLWEKEDERRPPWPPTPALEVERWQDDVQSWIDRQRHYWDDGKKGAMPWERQSRNGCGFEQPAPREPDKVVMADQLPEGCTWAELDGLLASTWLGLRRAFAASDEIRARNGSVLVHVGGGVMMELWIRSHERRTGTRDLRAAFAVTCRRRYHEKGWEWAQVTTHTTTMGADGSQYEQGYELPRCVYLCGHGVAADVTFRFSPWFAADTVADRLRHSAMAAVHDAQAAADD